MCPPYLHKRTNGPEAEFGAQVTPFRHGFGGVLKIGGDTGFAMGGARVSRQPDLGCNPDPQTGACTAELMIPVSQQISDYPGVNGDRLTRLRLWERAVLPVRRVRGQAASAAFRSRRRRSNCRRRTHRPPANWRARCG